MKWLGSDAGRDRLFEFSPRGDRGRGAVFKTKTVVKKRSFIFNLNSAHEFLQMIPESAFFVTKLLFRYSKFLTNHDRAR